jgi:hypothetical protein
LGATPVLLAQAPPPPALPTIQIDSPSQGQQIIASTTPLAISVSYSADPSVAIEPGSLAMTATVTGADPDAAGINLAVGNTTADVSSATGSITDPLVAGTLTITATVKDTTGQAAPAAVATYTVLPSFTAIMPALGNAGTTISLAVVGLDPRPGNNKALFRSADGKPVPFATVDRAGAKGTVVAPVGVVTGPVSVQVNGQTATDTWVFTVPTEFPTCGNVVSALVTGDGGWLVLYNSYLPLDSRCPFLIPRNCFSSASGIALRWQSDATGAIVGIPFVSGLCYSRNEIFGDDPAHNGLNLEAIAVAKDGSEYGVLANLEIRNFDPQVHEVSHNDAVFIRSDGSMQDLGGFGDWSVTGADFGADGKLYVVGVTGTVFSDNRQPIRSRLVRYDMTTGPSWTPELLVDSIGAGFSFPRQVVVSCTDSAFIGFLDQVQQVDIKTRAIVSTAAVDRILTALALNCHTNELWATRTNGSEGSLLKGQVAGNPAILGSFAQQSAFAWRPDAVSFTADGGVDVSLRVFPWSGLVRISQIDPCQQDGQTSALPHCGAKKQNLTILSTTTSTRWLPQKDVTSGARIEFNAPDGVTLTDATLTVTGAAAATVNAHFDSSQTPYVITWPASSRCSDVNTPSSCAAAGNYHIAITATTDTHTTLSSDGPEPAKTHNSTLSLVEVKRVRFLPLVGSSDLEANPKADGITDASGTSLEPAYRSRPSVGLRVFPEASAPYGAPVFDHVYVVADIEPPVEVPVPVYFRSLDVADPGGASISKTVRSSPFADNRSNNFVTAAFTPPNDNTLAISPEGLLGNPDGTGETPGDIPKAYAVPVPADGAVPSSCPDPAAPVNADAPAAGCQAQATLHVSRQQGDNYRVAASTASDWLAGLSAVSNVVSHGTPSNQIGQVTDRSGQPLVDAQSGEPMPNAVGGNQLSPMLTVWRRCHLEVSRMASGDTKADQARMDFRGTFSTIDATHLNDATSPFVESAVGANERVVLNKATGFWWGTNGVLHSHAGDWVGANLWLSFHSPNSPTEAAPYNVESSTANQVTVTAAKPDLRNCVGGRNELPGCVRPNDVIADKTYVLRDDDMSALSMSADYSLAQQLFAQAYIELDPIPSTDIAFTISSTIADDRRNLTSESLANTPARLRTTKRYWSIQLISAFDGDPAEQLDPQGQSGNLGLAHDGNVTDDQGNQDGKPKAAVFLETIRDLYAKSTQRFNPLSQAIVIKRGTAHEMLHTFGLVHEAASIMCANPMLSNARVGGLIKDTQVVVLRDIIEPALSRSQSHACQ